MRQYILIENSDQLDIFIKRYRTQFIPIIYDVYCQALLEKEGQEFLTINHELSCHEIQGIYRNAWEMGAIIVDELDKLNEGIFYKALGFHDIKLFRITIKYLLSYCFLSNLFHGAIGLARILEKRQPCSIYYFPFNIEEEIFSYSNINSYFCPKRIIPAIIGFLKNKSIQCIELNDYVIPERTNHIYQLVTGLKSNIKSLLNTLLFSGLHGWSSENGSAQKNILIVSCDYHLKPLISNLAAKPDFLRKTLGGMFYIVGTDVNGRALNLKKVFKFKDKRRRKDINWDILNFNVSTAVEKTLEHSGDPNDSLQQKLLHFAIRIIERFFKANIDTMITVWEDVKRLDSRYHFEALLWDAPPAINIQKGVISEYFKVLKKPRIGVQHGGAYGCKHYGYAHFDLDYDNCEYYFGYGYSNNDLETAFNGRKAKAKIVITPKVRNLSLSSIKNTGERIKVLYVFPENGEVPFFQLARPNRVDEFLFEFQKKIVDKLLQYNTEKIMLKFPPTHFNNHPLRVYIDSLKHTFIIETKPFTEIIKEYDAEYILIDVISTPLEQSISGKSQFLLFDNWYSALTKDAFSLLSKRAVITSEEEEFIKYIDKIFDGSFPKKDVSNTEYMEKYGCFPFRSDGNDLKMLGELLGNTPKTLASVAQGGNVLHSSREVGGIL